MGDPLPSSGNGVRRPEPESSRPHGSSVSPSYDAPPGSDVPPGYGALASSGEAGYCIYIGGTTINTTGVSRLTSLVSTTVFARVSFRN